MLTLPRMLRLRSLALVSIAALGSLVAHAQVTAGITGTVIGESGAGAVLDRFDDQALAAAIERIEGANINRDQVRAAARRWFALDDGVDRYDAIYRSIRSRRP